MLDCFFNKAIPKSSKKQIIIPPASKTFVTGLAYQYKEMYPKELEEYIDFDDYQRIITDVNETLMSFWPCLCSMALGYGLAPCTLGLSLCLPNICIKDAEETIRTHLRLANQNTLSKKGVYMELRKKCFTSWIEVNLPGAQTEDDEDDEELKVI